ncbi:unnamed protein product [Chrysoparadoxa australica]
MEDDQGGAAGDLPPPPPEQTNTEAPAASAEAEVTASSCDSENVEVSPVIHIRGLPKGMAEAEICALFTCPAKRVKIVGVHHDQALVQFETEEEAKSVIEKYRSQVLSVMAHTGMPRTVYLSYSRHKEIVDSSRHKDHGMGAAAPPQWGSYAGGNAFLGGGAVQGDAAQLWHLSEIYLQRYGMSLQTGGILNINERELRGGMGGMQRW